MKKSVLVALTLLMASTLHSQEISVQWNGMLEVIKSPPLNFKT